MNLEDLVKQTLKETKDYQDENLDQSWADFTGKVGIVNTPKSAILQRSNHRLLKISLLAFGILSAFLLYRFNFSKNETSIEVKSTKENTDTLKLIDNSTAVLSPFSKLTYPTLTGKSTSRLLSLEGSALFKVAPDKQRPFIVDCGEITVTALGTVFSISQSPEKTIIRSIENKIKIFLKADGSSFIMSPGDVFAYSKGKFENLTPLSHDTTTVVKSTVPSNIKTALPAAKPDLFIRNYRAKDVIAFLKKKSLGKIKVVRKAKFDANASIKTNLSKSMDEIVHNLTTQSNLQSRPGKCKDCIELYSK